MVERTSIPRNRGRTRSRQKLYRIVVLVDVKQRDLPGHALLKEVLEAKYPCRVTLLPATSRRAVLAFKPHLVVLMQLLGTKWTEFSRFLKTQGILVVSLPTEGVPALLQEDFLDFMAGRFADKSSVDLQFFWCEEIMARAVRNETVTSDRARVIGVPRFDFYHPTLGALRMPREKLLTKYGLDPTARTVTWTTNFATADLMMERLEREVSGYNLRVSVFRDLPTLVSGEKRTREEIARCLRRWALDHRDTNLIIRPHPTETRGYYERFYDDLCRERRPQVALVVEEPIWDVLEATDVLVQRCCTTGLEGWLMGLPTIETRFNPTDVMVNEDRDRGSDIVTSYAEFARILGSYLAGGEVPETQREAREGYVTRWFHRVDGRRTVECADEIWRLLKSNNRTEPKLSALDRWVATGVWIARGVEARLRLDRITNYVKREKFRRRSDTYLTVRETWRWCDHIRRSGTLEALIGEAR